MVLVSEFDVYMHATCVPALLGVLRLILGVEANVCVNAIKARADYNVDR